MSEQQKVVCPLRSIGKETFSTNNSVNKRENISMSQSLAPVLPYCQQVPDVGWGAKFQYEIAKMNLGLEKEYHRLKMLENHEAEMQAIKTYAKACNDLRSCKIFVDDTGEIFVAITDSEEKELVIRKLFSKKGFCARKLEAYYPKKEEVILLEWDGGVAILFSKMQSGNQFLKKLKARGLHLNVSARMEKTVAEALWAYIVSTAEDVELPGCVGWNKLKDGQWHFARKGELTMKEVLKIE